MKLEFVAVRETQASRISSKETPRIRVFLILFDNRDRRPRNREAGLPGAIRKNDSRHWPSRFRRGASAVPT